MRLVKIGSVWVNPDAVEFVMVAPEIGADGKPWAIGNVDTRPAVVGFTSGQSMKFHDISAGEIARAINDALDMETVRHPSASVQRVQKERPARGIR